MVQRNVCLCIEGRNFRKITKQLKTAMCQTLVNITICELWAKSSNPSALSSILSHFLYWRQCSLKLLVLVSIFKTWPGKTRSYLNRIKTSLSLGLEQNPWAKWKCSGINKYMNFSKKVIRKDFFTAAARRA